MKTNLITRLARPTPANDFRLFLQQELGRRCTRNPQYSLRAFAKFLAVDHATLSQWLRGRRRLTTKAIERLGGRLKLSAKSIAAYVANERLLGGRDEAEPRRREVQQLASDTANLIADWYHYAILELVRLREFKADSRWIGRVLGISVDEVNVALQRLLRLGLLEMTDSGRWRDKSGDTTASIDEFTTVAIQRLFEQSRRLSLAALTAAPPELREHSSMTLAMAVARVPAVIEALARFREELLDLFEHDDPRDAVYQLEMSFFPLTQLKCEQETNDGTARDAVADRDQKPRSTDAVLRRAVRVAQRGK